MNRAEAYLKFMNWGKSNDVILAECQEAFVRIYKMRLSDADKQMAWEFVAGKAPVVAYVLIKKNNGIWSPSDPETLLENIWNTATSYKLYKKRELADVITLSALMEREIPLQVTIYLYETEEVKVILEKVFSNLKMLDGIEKSFLSLLKTLYNHCNHSADESFLYSTRASFIRTGIEDMVYRFAAQTILDGNFRLFYAIKKAYSLDYERIPVQAEEVYEGLCKSKSKDVFRGGLVYLKILKQSIIDDSLCLKKWYDDIHKLKQSDISASFRMLYICKSLQMQGSDPDRLLFEMQINLSNLPSVLIDENRFLVREYRWAVYTLIKDKHVDFCREFLERTCGYNVDRYTCSEEVRNPYSEEYGIRKIFPNVDENLLLNNLYEFGGSLETVVFIYMNSFLRMLVGYGRFVQELCEKFEHNPSTTELKKYKIGGTITYDDERKIGYLKPNTVIKRWNDLVRDKFFLSKESLEVLINRGFDGDSWFAFQLDSFNKESKVFKFSVMGFADQRLESLITKILEIGYSHVITNELDDEVSKINIALVEKDSDVFARLCIAELSMILSFSYDREIILELLDKIRKVNYYAFRADKNSTAARDLRYNKNLYREITQYWEGLYKSSLNVMDSFAIYRNTILRHKYCLSEFVERFVEADSYTVFINKVGVLNGFIEGGFCRKTGSDDTALVFVRPSEFKKYRKLGDKKRYDRFIVEVPLCGQSARSVKKDIGIKTNRPVRFEIDSYKGNGDFYVKNIKYMDKHV